MALGADMRNAVVDAVIADLESRGHRVLVDAPDGDETLPWPGVGERVARRVVDGTADQGVLFCWTGTGVSIAANKVPGIRAALCRDAQTAAGARKWNDANVLVMGLRATSAAVAGEILDAWFAAEVDPSEAENIAALGRLDGSAPKSGG